MLHKLSSEGKKRLEKRTSPVPPGFLDASAFLSLLLKMDLGKWMTQESTAAACSSGAGCKTWATRLSWKTHRALSRVPSQGLKTGASVRLGNYSPQIYSLLKRLLRNAAGKTPTVTFQYSLSNVNTKICYNVKNTEMKGCQFLHLNSPRLFNAF